MKYYAKPSLEVISMKTSENIADNAIKTLYENFGDGYVRNASAQTWDMAADLGSGNGSVVNS